MIRVRRVVPKAMAIAIVALGVHFHPAIPVLVPGPSPAEATHAVEGFGAATTGGAGRPECLVTSLADSGPGTLRSCLSAGNRYIRFAVAGTIALSSTINVPSNVTIDGFSARAPGITVTNRAFNVWDASNVIMQGFRIRSIGQSGTSDEIDCISVFGAVSNLVFNHMSISDCGDGAIDISTGPRDITIQWSILGNAKGVLWGTTGGGANTADRISMHHTMMICNQRASGCDRFPLIRASGGVARVDLRHNIFEGWLRANGTKIEPSAWVNVVGNAYIPRADATASQREASLAVNAGTRVYTSGNVELGTSPRPNLNDNGNQSSPMPAPAITAHQLGCVVRDAGTQPRDADDRELVSYVNEVPVGCDDEPTTPPPPPPPTQRPDLVARALSAPNTGTAGQTFSVSATVANQGTATAAGSTARIYLSTDRTVGTGDPALGSFAVPSLAPNATYTGTTTVTLPPAAAGDTMLLVRADDGATIAESSETNNVLAIPFTIAGPSGPFTPILREAESMALGTGMSVGTDSRALGGRYVSPTGGASSTSPTRQASVAVTIPTAGTYYLWARMYGPSAAADALYLGIDASWDRAYPSAVGTYEWVRIETGNGSGAFGFQLAPGTHTIQVGRGEVDTRLDAVYLTSSSSDVPRFGPTTSAFTPVLLEAESMSVASGMSVGTDSRALGGRYVSPTGGASSTTPTRQASVAVTIPTAGTYYLWARMYGPSAAADALYLGIDASWDRAYPSAVGTYEWVRIETGNGSGAFGFQLAPGTHTVQVGRGEVNTRLDAVYVTNNANEVPTFAP